MPCFVRFKICMLLLFISFTCCSNSQSEDKPAWTVLIMMQADNNLYEYASSNLEKIKSVGSSKDINILVQLDEPHHHITWRYKVEKKKLVDDGSLHQEMGMDPEQEVVDAVKWVALKYPSKYFMLVLWNHGSGILDENRSFVPSRKLKKRGILYDFSTHNCLNNQQFARAMATVKNDILKKPVDILGMDACLMANLETVYQIRNSVNLVVASENIEKPPGWFYTYIFSKMISKPSCFDPQMLATEIVSSFSLFNRKRNTIYTQSAVKMRHVEKIKDNVDEFIKVVSECKNTNEKLIKSIIKKSRMNAVEFDKGNFVDLYSFYICVSKEISTAVAARHRSFEKLKDVLHEGIVAISEAILAKVAGPMFPQLGGLSIYFPIKAVHESYPKAAFARNSGWLKFLEEYKT
jgi:hypothetical protein